MLGSGRRHGNRTRIIKFQNLIGMLGSIFTILMFACVNFVSKPYRYARKPTKIKKPPKINERFKTL